MRNLPCLPHFPHILHPCHSHIETNIMEIAGYTARERHLAATAPQQRVQERLDISVRFCHASEGSVGCSGQPRTLVEPGHHTYYLLAGSRPLDLSPRRRAMHVPAIRAGVGDGTVSPKAASTAPLWMAAFQSPSTTRFSFISGRSRRPTICDLGSS